MLTIHLQLDIIAFISVFNMKSVQYELMFYISVYTPKVTER